MDEVRILVKLQVKKKNIICPSEDHQDIKQSIIHGADGLGFCAWYRQLLSSAYDTVLQPFPKYECQD